MSSSPRSDRERGDSYAEAWEAAVRALLASSLDAVVVIDGDGCVLEWSTPPSGPSGAAATRWWAETWPS